MTIEPLNPNNSESLNGFTIRWNARRIRPSHGLNMTGRYPLGRGRGSIPFESFLECRIIAWLSVFDGLASIQAQPLTIRGRIAGRIRSYTPDFLVKFSSIPRGLAALGFSRQTFIEVKPEEYAENSLVIAKLEAVQSATGITTILITNEVIRTQKSLLNVNIDTMEVRINAS